MYRIGSLALMVSALVACGDDGGQTLGTSSTGSGGNSSTSSGGPMEEPLPCELAAMIDERCEQCHGEEPQFGALRSLVSRDDLVAGPVDGEDTVAEACVARMRLPSSDEKRMPLAPKPIATTSEIMLLESWINSGFPARDEMEVCE